MAPSRQESHFNALVAQLQVLRQQGEALGLFMEDRDLLECPSCGLQEDVAADGRLITHERETPDAPDTWLRFTELPDGQFACPRCHTVIAGNVSDQAIPDSLEYGWEDTK